MRTLLRGSDLLGFCLQSPHPSPASFALAGRVSLSSVLLTVALRLSLSRPLDAARWRPWTYRRIDHRSIPHFVVHRDEVTRVPIHSSFDSGHLLAEQHDLRIQRVGISWDPKAILTRFSKFASCRRSSSTSRCLQLAKSFKMILFRAHTKHCCLPSSRAFY